MGWAICCCETSSPWVLITCILNGTFPPVTGSAVSKAASQTWDIPPLGAPVTLPLPFTGSILILFSSCLMAPGMTQFPSVQHNLRYVHFFLEEALR